MEIQTLTCNFCHETKSYDEFSKKSTSKTGRNTRCKACHNKYCREIWYPKNREAQLASSNTWKQKNKHKVIMHSLKISEKEALKFCKREKDQCDICETKENLKYDHCHITGSARGILCMQCNMLLGLLGDNIENVKYKSQRFIDYLENPSL